MYEQEQLERRAKPEAQQPLFQRLQEEDSARKAQVGSLHRPRGIVAAGLIYASPLPRSGDAKNAFRLCLHKATAVVLTAFVPLCRSKQPSKRTSTPSSGASATSAAVSGCWASLPPGTGASPAAANHGCAVACCKPRCSVPDAKRGAVCLQRCRIRSQEDLAFHTTQDVCQACASASGIFSRNPCGCAATSHPRNAVHLGQLTPVLVGQDQHLQPSTRKSHGV